MDGPQPAEARSRDAPHPGSDRDARRGSPARARARRVLVHHQADDDGGTRSGDRDDQGLCGAATQAAARRRGQRRRAVEHPRTARPRRRRHRHRRHGRGGARRHGRAAMRLRGARPAAAGHVGLRGARAISQRRGACEMCRWSCSPDASCPPEEDAQLHTLARSVVVKGVESPERLLDETALFLHRVLSDLPPRSSGCSSGCTAPTRICVGKSVLVVDDDVRNIFALSSVLERRGMKVLTASTGNEAIRAARRLRRRCRSS